MVSQNLIEQYLIDHLEYEYNKFKIKCEKLKRNKRKEESSDSGKAPERIGTIKSSSRKEESNGIITAKNMIGLKTN